MGDVQPEMGECLAARRVNGSGDIGDGAAGTSETSGREIGDGTLGDEETSVRDIGDAQPGEETGNAETWVTAELRGETSITATCCALGYLTWCRTSWKSNGRCDPHGRRGCSARLLTKLLGEPRGAYMNMARFSSRLCWMVLLASALTWPTKGLGEGGRGRPSSVPVSFVETPFGYSHPSCVYEVAEDEVVQADGSIDGTAGARSVPPCSWPRYDRQGRRHDLAGAPDLDAWVAYGWVQPGALEWISATWTVPPAPSQPGAQRIYLFPGLFPTYNSFILQPVLAWNGADGLGQQWFIYSWNCCTIGNQYHSTPRVVVPGEVISGYVWGANCDSSTGVCSDWQIRTSSTDLSSTFNTTTAGAALPYATGGALEVNDVTSCNMLPAANAYSFQNISVRRVGGTPLVPAWNQWIDTVSTPQCVSSVTATAGTITINRQCEPGLTLCSGVCANLATDRLNCGACGSPCPGDCIGGACAPACPPGTHDCCGDGTCLPPAACRKVGC